MLKGYLNNSYETEFINKVELAKGLPIYTKLEKSAQDALYAHTGCGLTAIRAIAFIDRLTAMSDNEFIAWATALSA